MNTVFEYDHTADSLMIWQLQTIRHHCCVTVAQRFASEYGVVRISLGDAMRLVLTNQPKTSLANDLQYHLRTGETVTDELAIAALQVALMDMNCTTRG